MLDFVLTFNKVDEFSVVLSALEHELSTCNERLAYFKEIYEKKDYTSEFECDKHYEGHIKSLSRRIEILEDKINFLKDSFDK